MRPLSLEHRYMVATTEAWHAAAAHVQGLEVLEVSIEVDDRSYGHCNIAVSATHEQALAKVVAILAGEMAVGEEPWPVATAHGDEGLLYRLLGAWSISGVELLEARDRAQAMLRDPDTKRLALGICDALLARRELTGADVARIVVEETTA